MAMFQMFGTKTRNTPRKLWGWACIRCTGFSSPSLGYDLDRTVWQSSPCWSFHKDIDCHCNGAYSGHCNSCTRSSISRTTVPNIGFKKPAKVGTRCLWLAQVSISGCYQPTYCSTMSSRRRYTVSRIDIRSSGVTPVSCIAMSRWSLTLRKWSSVICSPWWARAILRPE